MVAPFAGFSDLLDRVYGDQPNPVVYVLSWVALGLSGMIAVGGLNLYLAYRNPKSIRAFYLGLAFLVLMYAPLFAAIVAMRQAIEAKHAGVPSDTPMIRAQQRSQPATTTSGTIR